MPLTAAAIIASEQSNSHHWTISSSLLLPSLASRSCCCCCSGRHMRALCRAAWRSLYMACCMTNGRRCSVFVRLPDTDNRGGLPPSSRGRATDHPWRTPNQQTQQLNLTTLRKILRRTVSHSACPSASVSPEIRVFDRHQNLCVCFPTAVARSVLL